MDSPIRSVFRDAVVDRGGSDIDLLAKRSPVTLRRYIVDGLHEKGVTHDILSGEGAASRDIKLTIEESVGALRACPIDFLLEVCILAHPIKDRGMTRHLWIARDAQQSLPVQQSDDDGLNKLRGADRLAPHLEVVHLSDLRADIEDGRPPRVCECFCATDRNR